MGGSQRSSTASAIQIPACPVQGLLSSCTENSIRFHDYDYAVVLVVPFPLYQRRSSHTYALTTMLHACYTVFMCQTIAPVLSRGY